MYLKNLHERLIDLALRRVRAGEITERGLAKLAGISQPHMHNVLKRVRSLSSGSADRLMRALQVTVGDLSWGGSWAGRADVRAVPLLSSRLGPGGDAAMTVYSGTVPLPADLVAPLVDPVAVRLAPDLALPRRVAVNDLALLDQNPEVRSNIRDTGLWVVAEADGHRVRYLRASESLLYVINEVTLAEPRRWQPVSLAEEDILDVVKARVVWIGREMEEPTGP